MAVLQKIITVEAKVYPEPIADVIEWTCPGCKQHQKEYTYHIQDRNKVQCERCGKNFTIIKEGE